MEILFFDFPRKSDEKAVQSRNEGNRFYQKSLFLEALLKYNESLCFALDREHLGIAFANRSAVFLELKLYGQCLNNIKLARDHKYPDKLSKLRDREARCQEQMLQSKVKLQRNPFDYIKLSYEVNPKIPLIIDDLEVKWTKKYGRGIYAKRSLKVGDVISIEKPFFKALYPKVNNKFKFNYCCICLKDNLLDLIPWKHCASMMFCGEKCESQARVYHPEECLNTERCQQFHKRCLFQALSVADGSIDELEKLMKECENLPQRTIFDFDLSNSNPESSKNHLRAALSLAKNKKKIDHSYADDTRKNLTKKGFWAKRGIVAEKFICLITSQSFTTVVLRQTLTETVPTAAIGAGHFLFSGLINHSCNPNVRGLQAEDKLFMVVVRPVEKGEQLFESYTGQSFEAMPITQRRMLLTNFSCDCEACKDPERYPTMDRLQIENDEVFKFAEAADKKDYASMKQQDVINESKKIAFKCQNIYAQKTFPNLEYSLLMSTYLKCLYILSTRHHLFKIESYKIVDA